jgi:hypothetical protein
MAISSQTAAVKIAVVAAAAKHLFLVGMDLLLELISTTVHGTNAGIFGLS